MKTATAKIVSASPYSQSKNYDSTDVPKEQGENSSDYEQRTWRNRLHVNESGNVFIPPMAFKNCITEAAKFLSIQIAGKGKATYTKHFEAGLLVTDPLELPLKPEDVKSERLFVPADGVRGSGKRVHKIFPLIPNWSGEITLHVIDETILNEFTKGKTVLHHVLEQAGLFIGIGRFRPRNNGYYGRFSVEKFSVV